MSDRELAEIIKGPGQPHQYISKLCRGLASDGQIVRERRPDGQTGNYRCKPEFDQDFAPPRELGFFESSTPLTWVFLAIGLLVLTPLSGCLLAPPLIVLFGRMWTKTFKGQ